MSQRDYTATELANVIVCENQHKLRFLPKNDSARTLKGTQVHEKFLQGKHVIAKPHDPDALFSVISSLGRLLATLFTAFAKLPLLAKGLVILLCFMIPLDAPWSIPLTISAILLFWLWSDSDQIKKETRQRKREKHPLIRLTKDQLNAELIYIEGRFQGRFYRFNRFGNNKVGVVLFGWFPSGTRLKGIPDLIVRDADGQLVPADCKLRKSQQISARDKVQLSCYRYIMKSNKTIFGTAPVADYGYIVFLNESGYPQSVEKISLFDGDEIERIADRASAIDSGSPLQKTSESKALCQNCLYGEICEIRI